ncbi:hypothetical protein M011DRAFT_115663 [Sporormia fimetaria CBS 119925]|uniref:Uncharacterized protein n=1 Tax=Sporormia fimetaria CBS 119925 TaxID=1340428 RepID=A0A6A6VPF2_9PLEO|nr:hypothetical protein M011DRAFT_115663 [Sporormia fimetaria CBS 119925]
MYPMLTLHTQHRTPTPGTPSSDRPPRDYNPQPENGLIDSVKPCVNSRAETASATDRRGTVASLRIGESPTSGFGFQKTISACMYIIRSPLRRGKLEDRHRTPVRTLTRRAQRTKHLLCTSAAGSKLRRLRVLDKLPAELPQYKDGGSSVLLGTVSGTSALGGPQSPLPCTFALDQPVHCAFINFHCHALALLEPQQRHCPFARVGNMPD